MKKKWITALLLGMTLAMAGCSDLGIAPTDTSPTEKTASAGALSEEVTPASSEKPEATANLDLAEDPVQTETPATTEAPVQMPEGIPEGFLDQELEERARAEAQGMQYSYVSEIVLEGTAGDFSNASIFLDCNTSISCNKIVSYYSEDGNAKMTKYFQDEKEVYSETYTRFGVLSARNGGSESWSLTSSVSYVETDAQGRKTAELGAGQKYFYAYDEAGRLAVSQIYAGDQLMEDATYAYDEIGNLTSIARTETDDDVIRETTYSYEWDENGRIASVLITFFAGGMMSNHRYFYEFHYFDNGPVMMVMHDVKGDMVILEHPAYVFLPSAEIKTMLETGSGFNFPLLEGYLFNSDSRFNKLSSLLRPQFETDLKDCCFCPKEAGKLLTRISQNYNGDSFTTIISRLLEQDEFQMDASIKTDEGAYYGYEGDKLSWSYSYGGGGTGFYRLLKYNSAGQPVEITIGADDEWVYEISYDKAGRMSKVLYDYSFIYDESKEEGTVKFSHDADGKLSAVNAEFSGEGIKDGTKKSFRLTYALKPYENSDAE